MAACLRMIIVLLLKFILSAPAAYLLAPDGSPSISPSIMLRRVSSCAFCRPYAVRAGNDIPGNLLLCQAMPSPPRAPASPLQNAGLSILTCTAYASSLPSGHHRVACITSIRPVSAEICSIPTSTPGYTRGSLGRRLSRQAKTKGRQSEKVSPTEPVYT